MRASCRRSSCHPERDLACKGLEGPGLDIVLEEPDKALRGLRKSRREHDIDHAGRKAIPVAHSLGISCRLRQLEPAVSVLECRRKHSLQHAPHDELVVAAPVPDRHGEVVDVALLEREEAEGRGLADRGCHIVSGDERSPCHFSRSAWKSSVCSPRFDQESRTSAAGSTRAAPSAKASISDTVPKIGTWAW